MNLDQAKLLSAACEFVYQAFNQKITDNLATDHEKRQYNTNDLLTARYLVSDIQRTYTDYINNFSD